MFASLIMAAALQVATPAPQDAELQAQAAQVPVAADVLDAARGGAETAVVTDQMLTALNSGNSINAETVGSGNIILDGAALSGFNGVGNFIMNTGHNNNLQSSMSVTVVMTPPVN
jgi:hypothetical protein